MSDAGSVWDDLRLLDGVATPDEHLIEVDKRPGPTPLLQTLALLDRLGGVDVTAAAIRRAAIVAHAAWKIDWPPPMEFGAWTHRLTAAEKRGMVRCTGLDAEGRQLWRSLWRGREELRAWLVDHPAVVRD